MAIPQPEGYLVGSVASKERPILVLHPWWGLNESIKSVCQELANEGFIAFAPDLYHGKVTDKIAEAEILATALDGRAEEAKAEIREAVAFLKEYADAEKVAVIGFSLGAYYALDLSAAAPEIVDAVVLFYGTGPADFAKSQASYLGHFADNDEYEPQESLDYVQAALKAAGRPVTFYKYENTGHWFFEPDRDVYNAAAAKLAWERTLAFLKA